MKSVVHVGMMLPNGWLLDFIFYTMMWSSEVCLALWQILHETVRRDMVSSLFYYVTVHFKMLVVGDRLTCWLACWLTRLCSASACLNVSPAIVSDSSFLLGRALGGSSWRPKCLGSFHPYRRPGLSFQSFSMAPVTGISCLWDSISLSLSLSSL